MRNELAKVVYATTRDETLKDETDSTELQTVAKESKVSFIGVDEVHNG